MLGEIERTTYLCPKGEGSGGREKGYLDHTIERDRDFSFLFGRLLAQKKMVVLVKIAWELG